LYLPWFKEFRQEQIIPFLCIIQIKKLPISGEFIERNFPFIEASSFRVVSECF
jgi:hypothetical protein